MGSLGLLEAEAVLASKRCQGASLRLAANKKFVEQRSPFTVAQVEAAERAAIFHQGTVEGVVAGNIAFMVHSRCRFSDLRKCAAEPVLDTVDGITVLAA